MILWDNGPVGDASDPSGFSLRVQSMTPYPSIGPRSLPIFLPPFTVPPQTFGGIQPAPTPTAPAADTGLAALLVIAALVAVVAS